MEQIKSLKEKLQKILKDKIFVKGLIVGIIFATVFIIFQIGIVEHTSSVEFCASCHSMQQFHDAWINGKHGTGKKGIIVAKCADCHLPHDNMVHYLWVKGISGTKDTVATIFGYQPDWIKNLEKREEFTYESGCRKCHVNLVAPGIPLKAFKAHRQYELGETQKTCISCHQDVGHGDLKSILSDKKSKEAL